MYGQLNAVRGLANFGPPCIIMYRNAHVFSSLYELVVLLILGVFAGKVDKTRAMSET